VTAPRSGWPFPRDAAAAARIASLSASVGERLVASLLDLAPTRSSDAPGFGDRSLVSGSVVAEIVRAFGLASAREAALLALPAATTLARPPISDFHVGAVGIARSGELVLGGNLEFSGASIHHTIHGEGFVTLRARALGLELEALAISEARPCAHCRQVLAEMGWADGLRLIDPLGADVALWDVYPAAFTPGDLGAAPAGVGLSSKAVATPTDVTRELGELLAVAAGRAHAPYSGELAVVALGVDDGRLFAGAVLESVAFNPTIGPLQDALVALAASGVAFGSIRDAWLVTVRDARVAHGAAVRDLLTAVAPAARLQSTYWA
jgi:cytidine deaminase